MLDSFKYELEVVAGKAVLNGCDYQTLQLIKTCNYLATQLRTRCKDAEEAKQVISILTKAEKILTGK